MSGMTSMFVRPCDDTLRIDVMSRFREILCGFIQDRLNTSLSLETPSYVAVDCTASRYCTCSYYSSINPTGLSTS